MYAKNQEVAACLPVAEKLKHFRLRDGRRRRTLDTPSEEPKLRQRRRNCTWIYLFRPYPVCFASFSTKENREKIALTASDEECVKGGWKIHEQRFAYLKKKPLTHSKNRDEKCTLPKCSSDIYNILIVLEGKKKNWKKISSWYYKIICVSDRQISKLKYF